MVIVRDSGEIHDPNKHESLKMTGKDRQTVSQFTRELVSPFRADTHPIVDGAHITEVEFPAALHELGERPNMQAVRIIELVAAGAVFNLEDARKLFEDATEGMDDKQKAALQEVWNSTIQARERLPHARTDIEVESTYIGLSRIVDAVALKNPSDKRLMTYLTAFGAGLTRKHPMGEAHANLLDTLLDAK